MNRCGLRDQIESFIRLDFAEIRRHTEPVHANRGFEAYLRARIDERGLSNYEAANLAGVSEGTIRKYTNPEDKSAREPRTIRRIARGLKLDPADLFERAGLPIPPDLASPEPEATRDLTLADLLDAIKSRFEKATAPAEKPLPPARLTDAQIRWRGRLIVRLETVAEEARDLQDNSAAAALCEMAEMFKEHLEAATAAEISEAQAQRQPANGE